MHHAFIFATLALRVPRQRFRSFLGQGPRTPTPYLIGGNVSVAGQQYIQL